MERIYYRGGNCSELSNLPKITPIVSFQLFICMSKPSKKKKEEITAFLLLNPVLGTGVGDIRKEGS